MGNLHHKAFPILREIVIGLSDYNIGKHGVCKGCMLGKHSKETFPSSEHRSKGTQYLVHSNVCVRMSIVSITSSVYYIFFFDDFSLKTWIYFLKNQTLGEF